jgi:hypothetical protein
VTGVVNTLARPILGYWQMTELASMTGAYEGGAALARVGSLDRAVAAARAGLTSALLADGAGDMLAWLTLSCPVVVVVWRVLPSVQRAHFGEKRNVS